MVRAALFLVVLGGCTGGTVPTDTDCTRAKNAACDHQLSCELAVDFQTCINELELSYICDFSKTRDEFKACSNATNTPCAQSMDEACFEVMCSKTIGCVEATAGDTSDELQ